MNFSCLFLALLIGGCQIGLINAKLQEFGKWGGPTKNKLHYTKITVDQSGNGDFSSIQSAIDYIPSNNKQWVFVNIKAGIYREKVKIPRDKPYIFLRGDNKRTTRIVWDDHDTTLQSATFATEADDIVARSITFVNSYNYPPKNNINPVRPAVAALVSGNKTAFYRCGFLGVQDTLWDDRGHHYFRKCSVEGSIDFIFGGGQSLYEGCYIKALAPAAFITAQARVSRSDTNGFVFVGCKVFGSGPVYLGRAWRGYARVLFYNSNFSDVIDPRGWNAWSFVGLENHITFAEHGNYGPGADTSKRVPWAKKLNHMMWNQLTSKSFVAADNWINEQPR